MIDRKLLLVILKNVRDGFKTPEEAARLIAAAEQQSQEEIDRLFQEILACDDAIGASGMLEEVELI